MWAKLGHARVSSENDFQSVKVNFFVSEENTSFLQICKKKKSFKKKLYSVHVNDLHKDEIIYIFCWYNICILYSLSRKKYILWFLNVKNYLHSFYGNIYFNLKKFKCKNCDSNTKKILKMLVYLVHFIFIYAFLLISYVITNH